MLTRQQRRAEQRAQAKVKVINPSAMQISFAAALHPTLWQPAPTQLQSTATDCSEHAPPQAQRGHSSKAAGPVVEAETKRCDKCRRTKPLDAFSRRGGRNGSGSYEGHQAFCKQCVSMIRKHAYELGRREARDTANAKADAETRKKLIADAGAKVETQIEVAGPQRDYTESGWPIDTFARTAQRIRTARYLIARRESEVIAHDATLDAAA